MSNFTPGNGFTIDLKMDEDSLARLYLFGNYPSVLEPALLTAMDSGTTMLQSYASDFMGSHFRHATGVLETSLQSEVQNPYLGVIWSDLPYAQRRNYGFSNKTDALGRYYAHDWGIGWAENTIVAEQYKVEDVFQAAIEYANAQLGRVAP